MKAEIRFLYGDTLIFLNTSLLSIIREINYFLKNHAEYGGIVEFNVI